MYYDSSKQENLELETSVEEKENITKSSEQTSSSGKKEHIPSPSKSPTNPGNAAQDLSLNLPKRSHNHAAFAEHSPNQQRMFFALGQELGHNAIELKENAKKHFNKECFNRLSNGDMMYLIDRLVKQKELRERMPKSTQNTTEATQKKELSSEERRREAEEANKKMLEQEFKTRP